MASHHEWLAQTCDKQFEPLVVVDSEDGVSWRGSSWQLAEEVLRLASELASLKAEASLLHELQEQAGATIAALRERDRAEVFAEWNRRAPLATDRERRLAEAIVYLLGPAEGPDWSDATADSILSEARDLLAAPSEPAKAWVERGSCIDDEGVYTFAVRWAETPAEEQANELAPSLYSEQYETADARDVAANRIARALGLEVR